MPKRRRYLTAVLPVLSGALVLGWVGFGLAGRGGAAERKGSAPAQGDVRVRGSGLCQFILHDFDLSPQSETAINNVVRDALREHQRAFGFNPSSSLRIRIRLFDRQEAFQDYVRSRQSENAFLSNLTSLSSLGGYFSGRDEEVVVWRQRQPSQLANVILHESSHAIMNAHYRHIPAWLLEGSATYFAFPSHIQDRVDTFSLKGRWAMLQIWLANGELPNLPAFLNLDLKGFYDLDARKGYTVAWSNFQHLMSAAPKKEAMRQMLNALQNLPPSKDPPDCAALLNQFYPGGLGQLEKDWHRWILEAGNRVLGDEREEYLKRQERGRGRR